MALKETIKHMRELLSQIETDLVKAEGGNKAASQRVRTGTVSLEKLAKVYRKESIHSEKGIATTSSRAKPKAKAGNSSTNSKGSSSSSHASHGRGSAAQSESTSKAKPKAKAATASSRPLQVKRPTAKLPRR